MDGLKFCPALRDVSLSPDLSQLALSCFAYSTNLVHFSPVTFSETTILGGNSFLGCTSLTGDFAYEGTNAIPGSLFQDTAITSFRAPRSPALGQRAFAGCTKLRGVVFAADMAFKDDAERTAFLFRERGRAGLLTNLVPKNRPAGDLKAPRNLSAHLSPGPLREGRSPRRTLRRWSVDEGDGRSGLPLFPRQVARRGASPRVGHGAPLRHERAP